MQDLKEIQIDIEKELGGASLNHLISYAPLVYEQLESCYTLNQALNIFGQSEEFQRNLYNEIQVIKRNKSLNFILTNLYTK